MPQAGKASKQPRKRVEEKWKTVARERAKCAGLPPDKVIAQVQDLLVRQLADSIVEDHAKGALCTEKERRADGGKAVEEPMRTRAFGRVAQEVLGEAGGQEPEELGGRRL